MEKIREYTSEKWIWCFGCRMLIREGETVIEARDKKGRDLPYHKRCWDKKVAKGQKELKKELGG